MKTFLVFATAAALATSTFAQQPSNNFSAPAVQHRAVPPPSTPQIEGGLQRGARLGNPLQMFNAFASQRYGDGHEFVTEREESDIGQRPKDRSRNQAVGLRLFSFSF